MPEAFQELLTRGANLAPNWISRVTAHPREGVLCAHLSNGDTYRMVLREVDAYTRRCNLVCRA